MAAVMATTFGFSRAMETIVSPKTSVYVGPAAAPIRSPVSGSKQPTPWKTSGLVSAGAYPFPFE